MAEAVPFDIEKYKCTLCKKYLREPYKTKCQHTFCKVCIMDKFKVNKKCPNCEQSLSYPAPISDEATKLEIEELKLTCPNSAKGCVLKMSLYEFEVHEDNCKFKDSSNGKIYCMLHHAGCKDEFSDQNEYQAHLANSSDKHFLILMETIENLKFDLNKEKAINKELREKIEKQTKTLQDEKRWRAFETCSLNRKLSTLEQSIEKGNRDIEDIIDEVYNKMITINSGSYVCIFEDFESNIVRNNREYSSEDFFATPGGYQCALDLEFSRKGNLSVYLSMQEYDNNENLDWPFHVKYSISIIHPSYDPARYINSDIAENKFKNPSNEDDSSWGWENFVTIKYLKKNGFLLNDTLIIRVTIRKV